MSIVPSLRNDQPWPLMSSFGHRMGFLGKPPGLSLACRKCSNAFSEVNSARKQGWGGVRGRGGSKTGETKIQDGPQGVPREAKSKPLGALLRMLRASLDVSQQHTGR